MLPKDISTLSGTAAISLRLVLKPPFFITQTRTAAPEMDQQPAEGSAGFWSSATTEKPPPTGTPLLLLRFLFPFLLLVLFDGWQEN